jgi:hypothetical protein
VASLLLGAQRSLSEEGSIVMKLKNAQRRRGLQGDAGLVLICEGRYQLDEQGEVDVADRHGMLLLQSSLWSLIGRSSDAVENPIVLEGPIPANELPPAEEVQAVVNPRLEDMTKEELIQLAEANGVEIDRRWSALKIAGALRAAEKDQG